MYTEDELAPLSALQHHLFCPRQCALIHVEQLWAENRLTAEGRILHERGDRPGRVSRPGRRTSYAVPLRSLELGLSGIADVVEFVPDPAGERAFPVEYKRGRPKAHRADDVQLCAQAICLEEMLGRPVPDGALFYGQIRRREPVAFDGELRTLVRETAERLHRMLNAGLTPAPEYGRRCKSCSMIELCQPRVLSAAGSVADWLDRWQSEE